MNRRYLVAATIATIVSAMTPSSAQAESWCAYPLWIHEWGVQVFATDGSPVVAPKLPSYFHRPGKTAAPTRPTAVRDLPVDSGIRALPVLHFYSAGSMSSPIPVGVEVGFTNGAASVWYPAVDRLRSATDANGPSAADGRRRLLTLRKNQNDLGIRAVRSEDVPVDPTRQLVWDRIELTPEPAHTPMRTQVPWVADLRGFKALWANTKGESERFVFYEADTTEGTALRIVRGDTFGPNRRHYLLENKSPHNVFDVFFVHRDGARLYVFFAPQIPAGKSAGFLVEDHAIKDEAKETTTKLRELLVDPTSPEMPKAVHWSAGECVMGRDPAIPTEEAVSHRLFKSEVDAILHVWGDRFFKQQGTTVLYREDTKALDALMPLSLYTDMYNHIVLHRAGLALWEKVALP